MKNIRISDDNQNVLFKGALILGVAYFANKALNNSKQNNANDNTFENESNIIANDLYNAGHTGIWGETEDEERIIEIAKSIKDFSEVSKSYRTMFGEDLNKELNRWLNVTELAQFKANLGTGKSTGGGGTTTPKTNPKGFRKGDTLYSRGDWWLRSTNSPYGTIVKTKGGEKWQLMNNPYYATIGGTQGWWVVIKGLIGSNTSNYNKYYVIYINALYKK